MSMMRQRFGVSHSGLIAFSLRVPATTFALTLGLVGLASAWATFNSLSVRVPVIVWILYLFAATILVIVIVAFSIRAVLDHERVVAEFRGPLSGVFVSAGLMSGVLLGSIIFDTFASVAKVMVLSMSIMVLLFAAWLLGTWIVDPWELKDFHPAFFLPTVAAAFVCASALDHVGFRGPAYCAMGIGLITFFITATILLHRLFFMEALSPAAMPLLSIMIAAPSNAGIAWFSLSDNSINPVQYFIGGYVLLVFLVLVRLQLTIRQAPFSPAYWAYAFSISSLGIYVMHWISAGLASGTNVLNAIVLALVTALIGSLLVRTLKGLRNGTYLPTASK
jgi:tellurite resistance protein